MKVWVVAASVALFVAGNAQAQETWGVQMRLDKSRSTPSCGDNTPPGAMTLSGDKLTYKGTSGSYDFKVAADGAVDGVFRTASGMRLRLIGNAKTREFEVQNDNAACRYKAVVTQ